jgi:hypothetical protein
MARKPKPYRHPRSLDALFPAPKPKRCSRGHSQTPEWRAIHGCSTCRKIEQAEARKAEVMARSLDPLYDEGKAEREHWKRVLPRLPDPYVLHSRDGRPQVFRSGGGRRPGKRRRVKQRA